jgi:hypothetical protein
MASKARSTPPYLSRARHHKPDKRRVSEGSLLFVVNMQRLRSLATRFYNRLRIGSNQQRSFI